MVSRDATVYPNPTFYLVNPTQDHPVVDLGSSEKRVGVSAAFPGSLKHPGRSKLFLLLKGLAFHVKVLLADLKIRREAFLARSINVHVGFRNIQSEPKPNTPLSNFSNPNLSANRIYIPLLALRIMVLMGRNAVLREHITRG